MGKGVNYVCYIQIVKIVEMAYNSVREVFKFCGEYLLEHLVVCNNQCRQKT